jgi:hypothetical protein
MKFSRFIVAIPAHDESERIAGALRAVDSAAAKAHFPVSLMIFANNCTDGTASVARSVATTLKRCEVEVIDEELPPSQAHAGGARRRAVAHALSRFGATSDQILVSTDADARLRSDAFLRMEEAFAAGAQVVLAKIECIRDPLDPVSDQALAWGRPGVLWRHCVRRLVETVRSGRLASPDVHDDYGGAGVALRVDAYQALGGFCAIPSEEDLELVRAADRALMTVNRQSGAFVDVLARAKGRARGGMAEALAKCSAAARCNLPCLVEHHASTIRRIYRNPTHANAFPAIVTEWEPVEMATAGIERAMVVFRGES